MSEEISVHAHVSDFFFLSCRIGGEAGASENTRRKFAHEESELFDFRNQSYAENIPQTGSNNKKN
jgi:hypothetical protein